MVSIVELTDMRMVQGCDRARFALESLTSIWIGKCRGQDFERNVAVQTRVTRAIHFAHPACAEESDDLVPAKMGAWVEHGLRNRSPNYSDFVPAQRPVSRGTACRKVPPRFDTSLPDGVPGRQSFSVATVDSE